MSLKLKSLNLKLGTELEARIENFEEENRELQEQISELETELAEYR